MTETNIISAAQLYYAKYFQPLIEPVIEKSRKNGQSDTGTKQFFGDSLRTL